MIRWRYIIWVIVALGLVLMPIGQKTSTIYWMTSWLTFSIAAVGLNLTLGYAGQISLAQAGFMGIGAYIAAQMTLHGYPWLLSAVISIAACFIVGLLLGYPALRVRGHFLAFVTLAFNTLVFLVLRNEAWMTAGMDGLSAMPRPDFIIYDTKPHLNYYYFTLLVTALVSLLMYGLLRSPWGRAFRALRENRIRAESLGLDTRRITLLAFAIGSAYAGLAGALLEALVRFINPDMFVFGQSLRILLMVVVGGLGSFVGPFLGAAVVIILPEVLRFTEGYYQILYALLVIVLMIYSPKGLVGAYEKLRDRLFGKAEVRGDMAAGAKLK